MPLHETHGISSGRTLADAQDEIYQLVLTVNDRFPYHIVLRGLLLVLGRYRLHTVGNRPLDCHVLEIMAFSFE